VEAPPPGSAAFSSSQARGLAWLCGALLVLAGLAVNLRSLGFGFLYLRDDDVNVTLNPHMGGLSADRLLWMFTDWSYVRRYIPLGWLNLCCTYELGGLSPVAYHAVALALYAANSALVFALVLCSLRLFTAPARERGLAPWDVGAAAMAAGWWALHPMRVETTAWVSGNLYGQAALLLFASLLAYMRTYTAEGGRRAAWLLASAAGYTASLFTYPIALGIPFLIVGLDWLWTRGRPARFPRLVMEKIVFLVPLAAAFTANLAARYASDAFGPVPGMREMPLASRAAQSAYVAAYYVWKPWLPFHLSPLYDTLFDFRPADAPFLLSAAAVIAASAAALITVRRWPAFAALWFGYLAAAAPFFGLTEKPHMASDRYGYFLTVIAAAVLAAGLSGVSARRARPWVAAASLALVAGLAWLSRRQLDIWTDDTVQHAYVERGLSNPVLLEDFRSRRLILEFLRGDERAASAAVDAYLRVNPASPGFQRAAAIIADKRRIGAEFGAIPYLAILHDRLALAFARRGEFREANDHFGEALRLDGRFYQADYDRALVLLGLGRCDEALGSFLWSAAWAPSGLPAAQRREFLRRLQEEAGAEGRPLLSRAARSALAR
jgi:tetratricopeptide (TPR) repeat protein